MAIKFKEIRRYLQRNVRLSICFENGHYYDYLMVSDIPKEKYEDLYVYGIGMIDVEFSKDVYSIPKDMAEFTVPRKDRTIEPAIEIVLHEIPRVIERKKEEVLLFKDLKPYLQMGRNFSIVNREDWSYELYEYKDEIPDCFDEMVVYGIGMEDNTDEVDINIQKSIGKRKCDSCLYKRMAIVLSNNSLME